MTERLLQYIWQFRHFNSNRLMTEQGDSLQIIHPGLLNTNQGPDFLEGRVRINGDLWAGNIELHLKTSDWKKHAHHKDNKYKNVVLHVVWENDLPESTLFNLPTLELQPRVSKLLLNKYAALLRQDHFIPCSNSLPEVSSLVITNWQERMLIERLQRKALAVAELLSENNNNWEETLWWMMARNFGIKVNADAFEAIARSIPLRIIRRHRNRVHQLEALLFGQAGLLNKEFNDPYPAMLQREYRFLRNKYRLAAPEIPVLFLRMRPSGFPSVRLAQLAAFLVHSDHFFASIKDCAHLQELKSLLQVTVSDYWNWHYRFDEPSVYKHKPVGSNTIQSVIINTIIPILYWYGSYHGADLLIEKLFRWMEELSPEKNNVCEGWTKAGLSQENAACSQALLELKTQYCDKKRCLDCAIGYAILKKRSDLVIC